MKINWYKDHRPGMRIHEKNGVTWLSFPGLDRIEGIRHGFSTRLGGVSEGIFSTMNLSFANADAGENVRTNFHRIAEAIGFDLKGIVMSQQTHTTNVRVVTDTDRGEGYDGVRRFHDVDGLVTNCPGITLCTSFADCVPLYLVDPVNKAVGLSHSGWRETAGRIGEKTIKLMGQEYGTRPEDVVAATGPSICQDCYEVSADVADVFREIFSPDVWEHILRPGKEDKFQLDLWEANRRILMEAGVPEGQIFVSELCTCCNPEFLFSHRASKGKRGNLCAFLQLKEE